MARGFLACTLGLPQEVWIVTVNGAPGPVMRDADGMLSVCALTLDAGRIIAIDVVRNPDKLTSVRRGLDD